MVAILLENFTAATHAEEINSERKKMQKSGLDKMHHTLDPIFDLLRWNTVKTESDDVEDETKDEIIIIASFVSSAAPLCRGAANAKRICLSFFESTRSGQAICTHALESSLCVYSAFEKICSHYSTDLDLSQKIDNLFTVMIGDEQVLTPFCINGTRVLRCVKI